MIDKARQAGLAAALVCREAFRRANGNLSLLARMFAVVAIAFASVNLLNKASPMFVFGGPGDATAFVIGQFEVMTQVWLKLMTLGTHVLTFLGLT